MDISKYIGKKTVIVGDVNTGKTTLSRQILDAMCRSGLEGRIAVLDLAPRIPAKLALHRGLKGVGGRLLPPAESDVLCLWAPLRPPRLSSRTQEEALEIARANAEQIEALLDDLHEKREGRDMVFINDVTLYLQARRALGLLERLREASCIVANGYYGDKLGSGVLSENERREMESLMAAVDQVIGLPGLESRLPEGNARLRAP